MRLRNDVVAVENSMAVPRDIRQDRHAAQQPHPWGCHPKEPEADLEEMDLGDCVPSEISHMYGPRGGRKWREGARAGVGVVFDGDSVSVWENRKFWR